jgi:hypothetical protein
VLKQVRCHLVHVEPILGAPRWFGVPTQVVFLARKSA